MDIPDFSHPLYFSLATVVMFIVVIGRYFLIAGLFHAVFYKWFPEQWKHRKINERPYKQDQFRTEIKWSMITAALFRSSR
jgi:hypothetical protein